MNKDFNKIEKFDYILDALKNFKKPLIFELGVNLGGSTKRFLDYIKLNDGKLFSVDIKDCLNVTDDKNWKFLKSNDLKYKYIIDKFPDIRNEGIDLLFIDSYHDPSHVKLLLDIWVKYMNKQGVIFLDDTESLPYKLKKKFTHSVINDEIDKVVKEFYYQNSEQFIYTKYFLGVGLSKLEKKTLKNEELTGTKVWKYNFIFSFFYLYIKKIIFFLRNFNKI